MTPEEAQNLNPGDRLFIVADGWVSPRRNYETEEEWAAENSERKIELVECRFKKFARYSNPGNPWLVAVGADGSTISAAGVQFYNSANAALEASIEKHQKLIKDEKKVIRKLQALMK